MTKKELPKEIQEAAKTIHLSGIENYELWLETSEDYVKGKAEGLHQAALIIEKIIENFR